MPRHTNKSEADRLFVRADRHADRGEMKSAFRLMLASVKLGNTGAQINVGNYYADGKGVRRSRSKALYWYKRAYRRGDSCAAHNIGILWRDEGKLQRALYWFFRAVSLGDDGSNLDIGKHFLHNEKSPRRAIPYLTRVLRSDWVCEADSEVAAELLRKAKSQLEIRRPNPSK
jgi:TPR repeat protein